jgi:hypothetical protein
VGFVSSDGLSLNAVFGIDKEDGRLKYYVMDPITYQVSFKMSILPFSIASREIDTTLELYMQYE